MACREATAALVEVVAVNPGKFGLRPTNLFLLGTTMPTAAMVLAELKKNGMDIDVCARWRSLWSTPEKTLHP